MTKSENLPVPFFLKFTFRWMNLRPNKSKNYFVLKILVLNQTKQIALSPF
jgi:hypothetical protein